MCTSITAFDFDGTLTLRDTFPLFLRHIVGKRRAFWMLLQASPTLIYIKLRRADGGKIKERLLGQCLTGLSEEAFTYICQTFATTHQNILRPSTVRALRNAQQRGDHVVIVTASLDA